MSYTNYLVIIHCIVFQCMSSTADCQTFTLIVGHSQESHADMRAVMQMIILQMGHMVNNVRSAFILIAVIVGNHMLIISHTDANHTDTATFPTKHKHVYEKCCKNQMTGASQRASCTVTKEWQNSNKLYSAYLWLFWGGWGVVSFCL